MQLMHVSMEYINVYGSSECAEATKRVLQAARRRREASCELSAGGGALVSFVSRWSGTGQIGARVHLLELIGEHVVCLGV